MNIVITGASSGIGFDTALLLSQNPQHKILAIARQASKLEALAAAASHRNIIAFPFDLSAGDYALVATAVENYLGRVHVLINNAGVLINKPFHLLADDDWRDLYETNVMGAVRMTRTLLPFLSSENPQERSHVVNIGSMGGFQGSSKFKGLSAYSASKAALANFTECIAEELNDENISANCLCLGAVQTEMLANAFPGYVAPTSSQQVAQFIAWFAENGHHFQNGKVIPVSATTP
jgi:NAD(P)-dependent dehydrogenase (short-subunit alcohol dehydrogenase family)